MLGVVILMDIILLFLTLFRWKRRDFVVQTVLWSLLVAFILQVVDIVEGEGFLDIN